MSIPICIITAKQSREETKSREQVLEDDVAWELDHITFEMAKQRARGFFTYTTSSKPLPKEVVDGIVQAFESYGYEVQTTSGTVGFKDPEIRYKITISWA